MTGKTKATVPGRGKSSSQKASHQKRAGRKSVMPLRVGQDGVKRSETKSANTPTRRRSKKSRTRASETRLISAVSPGDRATPSLFESQMQFAATMFRWSPLGFLLRYQELAREKSPRPAKRKAR
jgi:hypothetical protein